MIQIHFVSVDDLTSNAIGRQYEPAGSGEGDVMEDADAVKLSSMEADGVRWQRVRSNKMKRSLLL